MINKEFFKLGNFITLSIIILIWLVVHDRWFKKVIGADSN